MFNWNFKTSNSIYDPLDFDSLIILLVDIPYLLGNTSQITQNTKQKENN